MKRALLFAIVALILRPCWPCQVQAQTVSVIAILRFQDDTGTNVSADLTRNLATDLHKKLATRYTDVLPRLLLDAAASTDPSALTQIAALAKQAGARYVVRGGLLALTCESSASGNKVTAQLYADIVLADDGTVVGSVRAQGTGMDQAAQQSSAAVSNGCDASSADAAQAFANAIEQLADSIHQTVLGGIVNTPAPTNIANAAAATNTTQTTTSSQPDLTQSASQDADLQQLIAQAEILVSTNANPNSPAVTATGQALQALESALETKATLMQQGKDTSQSDQDIATQRQALQTAVAQLTADAASASSTGAVTATTTQTPEQTKGFLQTISDFASQSLSLLQNIQQMRAALQGLNESSPNSSGFQSGAIGTGSSPAEQALGECIGAVTDQHGHPIPNAQVAEQTSAASTLTDSNGQYDLRGLLVNQIATLTVAANGKTLTAQPSSVPAQIFAVSRNGER